MILIISFQADKKLRNMFFFYIQLPKLFTDQLN